jgi:hypothetical protein
MLVSNEIDSTRTRVGGAMQGNAWGYLTQNSM